ncbi:MAG: hypothetical protein AVDCRST_MAG18-2234 [uncultured Thermomicrobiales bacterium]|uniref:GH105 n=1 Tax=uncultured Thermomicrobiales bacterium TaxID=1645740 RepID=A0A6J4VGV8_9BACT|nr:MAG: hypothetical protein AVDCRST_MAG18-2234 [uncultured Thermomicrobiales bacterium]
MAESRREACEATLRHSAEWLAERAQVPVGGRAAAPFDDPLDYPHGDYAGAIRTEYDTKTRRWSINGPTWHAGQAIRALLVAERRLGDPRYREAALAAGEFMLRERLTAPAEVAGMLLTYEGDNVHVNVEVGFEGISGLLDLHAATGEARWLDASRAAVDALLGGYLPDEGLARDHYHVGRGEFVGDPENPNPGRAMLDDATLARLASVTGEARYADLFLAMAERLIREEGPTGTWLRFPPWRPELGRVHGRKSWWWGWPLLAAHDLARERGGAEADRFLAGAIRAAEWYLGGQNLDGGAYYTPDTEGRHNSYGLCTSVAAVSILFWADLWRRTGDERWLPAIRRAVGYLLRAQFAQDVEDAEVRGAFFESPNKPDGSLAPGFQVRDIATIFGIRALDTVLDIPELLAAEGEEWADTTMKW